MIDVNFYNSTVPILGMLEAPFQYVMPRIYMYFDDIFQGFENIGENLAVKEFNRRNKGKINISPEGSIGDLWWTPVGDFKPGWKMQYQMKVCHYFEHPLYNEFVNSGRLERPLNFFDV